MLGKHNHIQHNYQHHFCSSDWLQHCEYKKSAIKLLTKFLSIEKHANRTYLYERKHLQEITRIQTAINCVTRNAILLRR